MLLSPVMSGYVWTSSKFLIIKIGLSWCLRTLSNALDRNRHGYKYLKSKWSLVTYRGRLKLYPEKDSLKLKVTVVGWLSHVSFLPPDLGIPDYDCIISKVHLRLMRFSGLKLPMARSVRCWILRITCVRAMKVIRDYQTINWSEIHTFPYRGIDIEYVDWIQRKGTSRRLRESDLFLSGSSMLF